MKDTRCLSVPYCIHTPQVGQIITKSQSPFKDLKKLSDHWCGWQGCMSPSMSYLIKEFKIMLSFHLSLSSAMTLLGPPIHRPYLYSIVPYVSYLTSLPSIESMASHYHQIPAHKSHSTLCFHLTVLAQQNFRSDQSSSLLTLHMIICSRIQLD